MSNKLVEDFFIHQTNRPVAWGTKNLNLQAKDGNAKSIHEMIPKKFHQYLKVFEKKASERMPIQKPWNHVIDTRPRFEPRKAKIIPPITTGTEGNRGILKRSA